MIQTQQSCDPQLHTLAIMLAKKCRSIVQACLREEEWGDADREFYLVIRQGLEDLKTGEKR
jgi:hypothetical protein